MDIQFSSQCWKRAWNKEVLLETPILQAASLKFLIIELKNT